MSANEVPLRMNLQVTLAQKVLTSMAQSSNLGNVAIFTKEGDMIVREKQVAGLPAPVAQSGEMP